MEIKVLEDTKNKLRFEFQDADHTFCNILEKELWNDSHIKAAGYFIEHPLIGKPKFIVETDGKEKPKKALQDAIKRLKKTNEDFKKAFEKEIK